jgi:Uma2 family endonuclease
MEYRLSIWGVKMAATAQITLEQFLARPETKPAREYVCGEVFRKPMPTGIHSLIQRFFIIVLAEFTNRASQGLAGPEWRCVFGPTGRRRAYVPDITYIARERLTGGIAQLEGAFEGPPDLAIEVLSPGQSMPRFRRKIRFYLAHGVRLVWVIDAAARTVTVHAPGQDPRTLTSGDTLDGGNVLPAFSVAVDDIFAQLQV